MADIRESDKGYETRVFSITSKTHGKKQICIGRKYTENGHDRYNVYPVLNDTVGGVIGYYEVDPGTKVTDATSDDFDVARFGEPHFMKTGKTKEEEVEVEPPPKVKSSGNFKNIETLSTKVGNCFYETVTCALSSPPDYKTTADKVATLRKELGEYITKGDDVIERYNNFFKEDMYATYYDEHLNGMSLEEIEEDILKVRNQKKIPVADLNIEDFKKYKPSDVDGMLATELDDYFDGQKNLKGDDIKKMFLKKINTPGVYANEYIVTQYQLMTNTKLLFMDHAKLKYDKSHVDVNHFELSKWTIFNEFKIKEDTKFILSDYTDMSHFSLLVQINPEISVFTQKTLPGEVRKLVDNIETKLQEFRDQNVGNTKAKSKSKSDSDSDSSDSESDQEKSDKPKTESDSDDETKAKLKPKVVPETKPPEPVPKKTEDSYTKAELDKMKLPDLKGLLKDDKYKNVPKSLNKGDTIDCLLNPDQDKCKTKRALKKTGGDRFTRRK